MALVDAPRFAIEPAGVAADQVAALVSPLAEALSSEDWVYCGYGPMAGVPGLRPPSLDVTARVDGQFRLGPLLGFETAPAVVTVGLRSSRFAPIVLWEVLHALRPGGLWVDVDVASRCEGTPLCGDDVLRREYFRSCLAEERDETTAGVRCQVFRKTGPSPAATRAGDRGWTFGILTSGPSPRAAQMARDLLALDLPAIEVIVCGPRPEGVPDDPRVRQIDLERPEPRGWITRKKNLLVDAASHEQVCLLHDRYVVTPAWARALEQAGRTAAVATFPQVYFADADGRFPQRYPDYQVLLQTQGLDAARRDNVYDADRIFHPAYDDYAETAFCCGGLYVTTRSIWNLIRQDEALFHCEWEDIAFGLDGQRAGIPHRVLPGLVAESTVPHPLLLTRLHEVSDDGGPVRGKWHVDPEHEAAARAGTARFKPVVALTRTDYYARAAGCFHRLVPGAERLTDAELRACSGLADFWRLVAARVSTLPLARRTDVVAVCHVLSEIVYKWPNCQVLSWVRAFERARASHLLDGVTTVVGWGAGSLFRATHARVPRALAYTIDSNPAAWDTVVDGVPVSAPHRLDGEDPSRTALVVFSCAFDEIAAAIARRGPFAVYRAQDVVSVPGFQPLADIVAYFDEVERHYPVVFAPPALEGAQLSCPQ